MRSAAENVLRSDNAPSIGILHAGALLEDWLDPLGVSIGKFAGEMLGSWMFGYMNALRAVGVHPVLFCISARVRTPHRYAHRPTGGTICVLPAPAVYRTLGAAWKSGTGTPDAPSSSGIRRYARIPATLARGWLEHLATPVIHLRRELRGYGCRAILCQDYEFSRFDVCSLLAPLLGVPVFATFQGGARQPWPLRPLRRLALRLCSGLVISAEEEARRVRRAYGVPDRKISRIFDPIDLDAWAPRDRVQARAALAIPVGAKVVAWHGAVDIRYKGLDILLLAWEKLCRAQAGEDLRLLLIGTGSDTQELQRQIEARNLRGVIRIDEWVLDRERLACYLSAADVYAFPSRGDGFAISPIEAMACGLPLVTTDSRGMPDLVEGGEASGGVLVPREDVEALAAALERLIAAPGRCRELGARARARVAGCFSAEVIGRQLRDFLLPGGGP